MEALDVHEQKLEEPIIIKRIIGGEKQLYELLVRRNNQKLYRAIRSYLKDEAEVEDAMQNTYIKAYTKLHQFKQASQFSTWLIRIGINESLARLREKGKLYQLNEQSESINGRAILEMPDNNQLNPQQAVIRKEAKELLENAIDSLDTKYRAVYVLREIEGMNVKETATALDLTESNVKVRLHRSKELLKDKLFEISQAESIFEFGFGRCDRITEAVMNSI